jgi:hypothetical protein
MNIAIQHFYGLTTINKYHPYLRISRQLESIFTMQAINLTTLPLGHYVRLPFVKSLQDRNCSSTLRMKSWFHSDRSVRTVILGYLILPSTTTIE